MIFVSVCLGSLNMIISRSICVVANGIISFFFTVEQYPTVYVHHVVSVHSRVSGDLGCFCVLAIVHSAAVNIGISIFFEFLFSQDICPGVGLLGHMVALCL